MKTKILLPLLIILVIGVSLLLAQESNKIKSMLQNPKTQNEVISTIINNPQMMQNFTNHLTSDPNALNSMMGMMMNNQNSRQMMMNSMYSKANRDSSFANYMYNMMDSYPQMYSWMQNMMNENGMMGRRGNNGIMGRGMMNGGMMGHGMMGGRNYNYNNGNTANQSSVNNNVWEAPSSANNMKNPIEDIEKASREGKNIFNTQCYTCHGTNAKGDGPVAATLIPKPADLTSSRVQNESNGALYWKITHGNPPMPSFQNALTKNQRWDLVAYIKSLNN